MAWSGDDVIDVSSGATKFVPEFGNDINETEVDYYEGDEKYLIMHTEVPIDFNEWYFIVATFDPTIDDSIDTAGVTAATGEPPLGETAAGGSQDWGYLRNRDYWKGNVSPIEGTVDASGGIQPLYYHRSGYGSKCKVEIISKSDLLRARGYKS